MFVGGFVFPYEGLYCVIIHLYVDCKFRTLWVINVIVKEGRGSWTVGVFWRWAVREQGH